MATCGIALGGNIGNTAEVFDAAIRRLEDRGIRVARFSRLLRTPPMGTNAGDDFVNAAAVLETQLEPTDLLQSLHEIEIDLGRTRDTHWGPRRLDMDLLYHDQTVICTDQIVVPHPSFWYRRFVLQPLVEIAPDYQHPIQNQSVSELDQHLQQSPLRLVISGDHVSERVVADVEQSLAQVFDRDIQLYLSGVQGANNFDPFAVIVVDMETRQIDFQQPPHEAHRIIRVCCQQVELRQKLLTSLTDICGAVIG